RAGQPAARDESLPAAAPGALRIGVIPLRVVTASELDHFFLGDLAAAAVNHRTHFNLREPHPGSALGAVRACPERLRFCGFVHSSSSRRHGSGETRQTFGKPPPPLTRLAEPTGSLGRHAIALRSARAESPRWPAAAPRGYSSRTVRSAPR